MGRSSRARDEVLWAKAGPMWVAWWFDIVRWWGGDEVEGEGDGGGDM